MALTLVIGSKTYSSWSLRPWLALAHHKIPFDEVLIPNGTADFISHDRWFLDRIATHILAFEGDRHVEWFEGNFQDYEADKMRRLGQDSIISYRLKYKKKISR